MRGDYALERKVVRCFGQVYKYSCGGNYADKRCGEFGKSHFVKSLSLSIGQLEKCR